MNDSAPTADSSRAAERLQGYNATLSELVADARSRLEELENIVSAISGGQVDAVVVEQGGQPEVWTLEATDRLHLKLCQQAANVGTWHWQAATNELTCSENLLGILGVPANAQLGVDQARNLLRPEDHAKVTEKMQAALQLGDQYYDELSISHPDGARRWLAVRGRAIRGANGRMERLVGIALDITERRQAEEELKQADHRKDEFLAMLAHELRNPLAAISNAIRLSRTSDISDQDRSWVQAMLDRQMELLVRLVDDLLDVARFGRGRIDLKREVLPVAEVVQRAVESVQPQIDAARHTLDVQLGKDSLWIDADRTRLEQIIVNLLSNAAKYTPEGGKIWLQLKKEGSYAVLTVRDNGIGISREMLPKVFDMFAQAEQGLARSQGGMGIGLTLVRRLVEMHGGEAVAESPGTGLGSTFTVRLPLAPAPQSIPAAQTRPAVAARADARPLRVMIVDDNQDAAKTLALLLKFGGYDAKCAFDGSQALELAVRFRPQLALLDIGMPAMDGYELACRLKGVYPDIFLAALSGYGQSADLHRAKESGFDEHFLKPVKVESLLKLLDERNRFYQVDQGQQPATRNMAASLS